AVAGTLERGLIEVHGERLAQMPLAIASHRLRLICQEAELRGDIIGVRHAQHLLEQSSGLASYLAEVLARHPVLDALTAVDSVRLHSSLSGSILDRIQLAPKQEASLVPVWRANLPGTEGIDITDLSARLNLTGGQIRNASRLAEMLSLGTDTSTNLDVTTLE